MNPLSENDIKSELSYAYLHAVASKAGLICQVGNRHKDNRGIDAELTYCTVDDTIPDLEIKVQLKASSKKMIDTKDTFKFELKNVNLYNTFRNESQIHLYLIVVLCLDEFEENWLSITEEQLVMKKCAYWVNLRGYPETSNKNSVTIDIPKNQILTPENLLNLVNNFSTL